MSETVTREVLVQRARDIAPGIGERAAKAEELRRVPEETIQEICNAGLLAAFTPKRFGGYALEIGTVIETAREIGEVCGSSAWCLAIYSLHNHLLANFPDAAQDEVFSASPNPVVCGVFMPGGAGTPVDGGYRLTGEWNFASGCDHSSHAILSGLIRTAPDAAPTGLASFLVRREDFAIDDNWHVAGLRGTGSKRVVVDDVFVPTDFARALVGPGAEGGGTRDGANTSSRLPHNAVATLGLVGVALGIARGAIAGFEERLGSKLRVGSFRGLEEQIGAQYRLAESAVEVDVAELLALRDCDEMEITAASGELATAEQRGRYRRDAAYVFRVCAQAVARLQSASGAHAIFDDSPQQRAWRDTQVMTGHIVADWDQARETYAKALLGLEPNDPVF